MHKSALLHKLHNLAEWFYWLNRQTKESSQTEQIVQSILIG